MSIDFIGPVPKIKPGSDVHDIVQVCKGFLRQGHVQVIDILLKFTFLSAHCHNFGATNYLVASFFAKDFASACRWNTQRVLVDYSPTHAGHNNESKSI